MFIRLDFESETPIYEQLKNEIIIGIAKRKLLPGDRLPSVRAMASDIGINMHTVNKAYQQLKQAGYLLIHRQKGVVVHPDGIPLADEQYRAHLSASVLPLFADAYCRGIDEDELLTICRFVFTNLKEGEKNE